MSRNFFISFSQFNQQARILFSICLFLFSGLTCRADGNKIDSLFRILKLEKVDTNKVKELDALSWELSSLYPDSAMVFCNEALHLAEKINWPKGIGASNHQMGWVHYRKGEYSLAVNFNMIAISIWEQLIKDTPENLRWAIYNQQCKTLNNIGLVYWHEGNYPKALDNFLKALKIEERIGNKQMQSTTLSNIGNIYLELNDYAKALDYYSQALALAKELDYKFLEANTLANIGNIYVKQGELAVDLGNKIQADSGFNHALDNFFVSVKIREEIGDQGEIGQDIGNIGYVYIKQGNFPKGLEYNFRALDLAEKSGDKQLEANTLGNIGSIYVMTKQFPLAEKYLVRAITMTDSIGDLQGIAEINLSLSELYSKTGNPSKALEFYKKSIVAKDTLFNQDKANEITRKEMNYEFDKKEAFLKAEQEKKDALALQELQKQKLLRNGFIGGFAVMVLFAGIFFNQRNKIKKGKKHSDELLLNILPAEVAEELKQKGSAEAKQFNDVTVMFTDFKNFTQISENLSPAELVAEIDYCFKAFDEIMGKYNIEKIKTIGDSYMAAGGLPVANKTNAVDVINAALEIQKFMRERIHRQNAEEKEISEIRIGIHTGPVVAGIVGIKKFAYDIWGDTVNIASRMESSGEAGKINISGSTYELVKNLPDGQAAKFKCTHRGKIEAKNKGMVDMYFLEGI